MRLHNCMSVCRRERVCLCMRAPMTTLYRPVLRHLSYGVFSWPSKMIRSFKGAVLDAQIVANMDCANQGRKAGQ